MLTNYAAERKDIQKEYFRKIDHLERHRQLFPIAQKICKKWSERSTINYETSETMKERYADITYSAGYQSINCISVNLHLGYDDSIIKDIGPIIEDLKENNEFKFIDNHDYLEMGWKGWKFKFIENDAQLLVRAWFSESNKCEMVGTGKFEEVQELICQE